MNKFKIPLCHYPTTVVLVDDSQSYLKQFQINFHKYFPCLTFDKPEKALEYINSDHQKPFIDRCIQRPEENNYGHFHADFNIQAVESEVYLSDRFSEIGIIVVDYAMPGTNGLELCQQIKNPNVLLVLLTGEADNEVGLEAFNKGIIHKFIKKSTPDIYKVLRETIETFEKQYFLNLSNQVINQVSPDRLMVLKTECVAKFFNQWIQDHLIVEYYALSEEGDFLLMNKEGHPSWLTIKNVQQINDLYEYAKIEEVPAAILDPLKNKTQIPIFHSEEDMDPAPEDWKNYFCPSKLIPHSQDYYFAYKSKTFEKAPKKFKHVTPYAEYLNHFQKQSIFS